jgi:hypothetical protein
MHRTEATRRVGLIWRVKPASTIQPPHRSTFFDAAGRNLGLIIARSCLTNIVCNTTSIGEMKRSRTGIFCIHSSNGWKGKFASPFARRIPLSIQQIVVRDRCRRFRENSSSRHRRQLRFHLEGSEGLWQQRPDRGNRVRKLFVDSTVKRRKRFVASFALILAKRRMACSSSSSPNT